MKHLVRGEAALEDILMFFSNLIFAVDISSQVKVDIHRLSSIRESWPCTKNKCIIFFSRLTLSPDDKK